MKLKLKSLAVAVALSATAMSAQAEITGGSSSELFFSAWDSVAEKGYTFDLTSLLTLNSLVGGSDLSVNATNNAATISRIPTYAVPGVLLDVALDGFGSSFSSTSGVEWNLAAYDVSGRRRFISTRDITSSDSLASTNDQVALIANTMDAYAAQANSKMVDMANGVGTDSYANTVIGDLSAYAGNYGANWVNNVGDSTNLMGVTSGLSFFAQSATNSGNGTPLFANLNLTARTYQGAQGEWRLELAQVAAVPEPESYAMMLAGLAMLGGAARRRNNKA